MFLLLSRLNDDWVWGRSQRTGESGIIPIVIMEDVVRVISSSCHLLYVVHVLEIINTCIYMYSMYSAYFAGGGQSKHRLV